MPNNTAERCAYVRSVIKLGMSLMIENKMLIREALMDFQLAALGMRGEAAAHHRTQVKDTLSI